MIKDLKNNFFLFLVRIKQNIFIWLLKYKNQKILYIVIFIFFFINSLNILDISNHKNSTIITLYKSKSDFEDYYNASLELKEKRNPYYKEKIEQFMETIQEKIQKKEDLETIFESIKGIGTFLYPPFFAFILIPLSFFSYNVSGFIFQILQLLFFYFSIKLLFKIAQLSFHKISKRKIHFSIIVSIFAMLPFLDQNISNGNIGFLLIFLTCLSLYLFFLNHNKNISLDIINGIILGIATIVKILPGFVGGIYFTNRRYWILLGILIGILVGIFLPAIYVGWKLNMEYFTTWYELIIKSYQKYSVIRPYANNQTISAAISKLFVPFSDLKQMQYGLPLTFISIPLELIPVIIQTMNILLLGNLIIVTIFLAYIKNYEKVIFVYYLYLILLTSLLTSGISWYHSYGILIIPYFFATLYSLKKIKIHHSLYIIPVMYIWIYTVVSYKYKELLSLYSVYTWIQMLNVIILYFIIYNYIFKTIKGNIYEK